MSQQLKLLAGVLTAIGASLCCVAPLIFVSLGIAGTWISLPTRLEPLRPYLAIVTLLFLALSGYQLYFRNNVCAPDQDCANTSVKFRQRTLFWCVTVIAVTLLISPWLIAWFLS